MEGCVHGGLVTTCIQASVAARAASSTEADPNRSICTLSLQDVDGEVQGHKAQEAMTHSPPPLRDLLGDPSAPALPVCLSLVMLTALSYPVPNTIRFECEGRAHKQTSGSARMVCELGTCRVGALGSLCHQGCSGTCIRNIYRASSLRRQPFGGLVPAVSHATFPEAVPDVVCRMPPTYVLGFGHGCGEVYSINPAFTLRAIARMHCIAECHKQSDGERDSDLDDVCMYECTGRYGLVRRWDNDDS